MPPPMIPPYPIFNDGVTYVPSLAAPNQILYVKAADGQASPLSPRDLYFLQRLNLPFGQTWAVFGNNPPSAHFVQMGMMPPLAPMYATVLMNPNGVQPQEPPAMPRAPSEDDLWDPAAYEAGSEVNAGENKNG